MNPKVTIIMATYNRAHFIMETLLAIQVQTVQQWECLIIDDGSTDNTNEVIAPVLEKDNRFQYLKRTDHYKKGLPGCRNYGLDLAKGECVIFFDDDDLVHPDNLKICLEVLENKNIDFCHYQKMSFHTEKPEIENRAIEILKSLNKSNIKKVITQEIGMASCTVLWKKQCFYKIRFNENLLYAEEWECYNRIILEGFKGIIINNVLYYNRKHPNSNTGEFFNNNSIRRASKAEAILLVVQNLKEKQMLSTRLKKHFVTLSKDFSEFNLFEALLKSFELSTFEKMKWQFYYNTYPIRLLIYKVKKQYKRNK